MADFVFKRRQRPICFTWELDRDGCFRSFSKEFGELLGPQDAGLIGLPFDVVRKKFKMGKVPTITKAIKKQRAFTGVTVLWPVCNTAKVVPLDLSAQPFETKDGEFDGLRGFGVIRSVDAKKTEEDVDPVAVLAKLHAALHREDEPEPAEEDNLPASNPVEAVTVTALTLEHEPSERSVQEELPLLETLAVEETAEVFEESGFTAPGFLQSEPDIPELLIDFDEEEEEEVTSEVEPEAQNKEEPAAEVEIPETSAPVAVEPEKAEGDDGSLYSSENSELAEEPVLEVETTPEREETFLQLTDEDVAPAPADPIEIAVPVDVVQTIDVPAEEDLQRFEEDLTEAAEIEVSETPQEPAAPSAASISTSKDDFARAIANLPDAPRKKRRSGPRSLAELTNSIVRLVDKHPASRENSRLSKPERDAFDKIAQALSTDKKEEKAATPAPRPELTAAPAPFSAKDTAAFSIADNIIPLPAEPIARDQSSETRRHAADTEPKRDNVTHVVLPRVPPDIEEAAERAREKTGRIPDKPIVAPIDPRLLDRLPIGVAVVSGRDVVYANDTLLELLGYARFEALNEAGGLEAIFAEPEECPAPSSQTVDRIVHVRLATGGVLSVDARMHAVPWNGAQALMISVVEKVQNAADSATPTAPEIDIRSAPSLQLQHAQSRINELESVLATATDGVLVVDQKGFIRSANHSAKALFNAEEDDLLGAPLTQFLAAESHGAALDYLDGLVANGVSSVLNDGREVICQTRDGDIFPTFLSMGRVNSSDERLFCAVLRDITQFKRAEEELVSSRLKAEKANTHKSEYLTKISHEIRTPLNAVIGFSEVMQEERFGELGNLRYKEYARDINRSCSHMLTLINDLLDLAKIEAGKMDLTFEAVSAADIISECVALLQPQANDQRVIIRASTPLSVPKIVADPTTLRQITLNLLSNAIKFNRSGGQVIVSLVLEPSGEVHLRIRDTGRGMSKDDLEAALQPFRRLNASATTEGSGLGLPLTKALVEANRASFSINSEEDEGTLVQVTFPPQRVLAE